MFGIIYCVTNTANGKRYIGQTTRALSWRWSWHLRSARTNSASALHAAIRKYGADAFVIEQIDSAESLEELNQKESSHISCLKTLAPDGYNLTTGGGACTVAEETRQKISGWHHSQETLKKIAESSSSRTVSDESRKKNAKSHLGSKHTEETKSKISTALLGHSVSEETRRKISNSLKGTA